MKQHLFLTASLGLLAGCNEIVGIKAGDPIGSPIDCESDKDCPAPKEPECSTFVKCDGGTCSYSNQLDGKVVNDQVQGDCSQRVCDGNGGVRLQAYDADVEDDGKPCTLDTCEGGLAKHTPQQMLPCYEGPAGTEGMGICKGGIQICDANYEPIGGCDGQVLPAAESCDTPEDEDCDGMKNEEGKDCVCTPNATSPCYDAGPDEKAGVGACKRGTCLCNGAGTACASACTGDVAPAAQEDCATKEDDDCDGQTLDAEDGCVCVANEAKDCYVCDSTGKGYTQVPSPIDDCEVPGDDDCDGVAVDMCTGDLEWVKASVQSGGIPNYTYISSLAVDDTRNLIVAGPMYASGTTIDLGGGPVMPPASSPTGGDAFLAKYSPSGQHLWSKRLPCSSYSDYKGWPQVTVAGNDVVVAYYVTAATCDFGSGAADSNNGVVVVRLAGATGAYESKTVVVPASYSSVGAIRGAPDGSVVLGGWNGNASAPFLLKLDAANITAWSKSFAIPAYYHGGPANLVRSIAVLADGAIAITGNSQESTIDLGAGPQGKSNSYDNHYYAVFEPGGQLRWGHVLSSSGCCSNYGPIAVAAPASGAVLAVGHTYSAIQFCGSACQAKTAPEVEPNDTQALATPLPAGKLAFMGAISPAGDADYFAITVPANASLEIITSDVDSDQSCGFNTYMEFYDSANTLIASNDSYFSGCAGLTSAQDLPNLSAGTYYVKVTSSQGAIPAYRLNVTINSMKGPFDTIAAGYYMASFDAADGALTPITQLPGYTGAVTSASVDALGHTAIGGVANGTGVNERNAHGDDLWSHSLPLSGGENPLVVTGPDGTVYFAGRIFGMQSFDATTVGTANNYEVVWGRLAQ